MLLNDYFLGQSLSEEKQKKEIERLKNAKVGDTIFTTGTFENTDVEETLLHRANVSYIIRVANGEAQFVKIKQIS